MSGVGAPGRWPCRPLGCPLRRPMPRRATRRTSPGAAARDSAERCRRASTPTSKLASRPTSRPTSRPAWTTDWTAGQRPRRWAGRRSARARATADHARRSGRCTQRGAAARVTDAKRPQVRRCAPTAATPACRPTGALLGAHRRRPSVPADGRGPRRVGQRARSSTPTAIGPTCPSKGALFGAHRRRPSVLADVHRGRRDGRAEGADGAHEHQALRRGQDDVGLGTWRGERGGRGSRCDDRGWP